MFYLKRKSKSLILLTTFMVISMLLGNVSIVQGQPDCSKLLGSDQSGNLFDIDINTAAAGLIGNSGRPLATEIEYDDLTDTLYAEGVDGVPNLDTIDPTTGAFLGTVTHPLGALNGLEFVGSTLYGTFITSGGGGAPSTLVIVNTTTGVLTPVGPTGLGPISGLAYEQASQVMYGITAGGVPAQLVTINLATGAAAVVGPTGVTRIGSIEFGPDGNLYGGVSQNGANPGDLLLINKNTGVAAVVGNTGFSITGLTSCNLASSFGIAANSSVNIKKGAKVQTTPLGWGSVASNGTLVSDVSSLIEGKAQSIVDTTLGKASRVFYNAITNGPFTLNTNGHVKGDVDAASVLCGKSAKIDGDVTSGGAIIQRRRCTIGGAINPFDSPKQAALVLLPTCQVTAPGGPDLQTGNMTGPHTVNSGNYGNYIFGTGNTVIFTGSTYSFKNLKFNDNTLIEFQAPTTIHIDDSLIFNDGVRQNLALGLSPEDIIYRINNVANAGTSNRLYGTFCGPNAQVTIRDGSFIEGAIYADEATIGINTGLITSPADLGSLSP